MTRENTADYVAVSSQIYRSVSASQTPLTRASIGFAMVIAAILALIGIAAMIAGLTGITGVEPIGVLRSVFYMGLGAVGGGAGGLLLIALDALRHPVQL